MDPVSVSLLTSAIVGFGTAVFAQRHSLTSWHSLFSNLLVTLSSPVLPAKAKHDPSIPLVDLSSQPLIFDEKFFPIILTQRLSNFHRIQRPTNDDKALTALSVVFRWISHQRPLTPHPPSDHQVNQRYHQSNQLKLEDPLAAHRSKVLTFKSPLRQTRPRSCAILRDPVPLVESHICSPIIPQRLTPPSPLALRPTVYSQPDSDPDKDQTQKSCIGRKKKTSLYLSNVDTLTSFAPPRSPFSPLSPPKRSVSSPFPSSETTVSPLSTSTILPLHSRVRSSSSTTFSPFHQVSSSSPPFSSRTVRSDCPTPSPLFVQASASAMFDRFERAELDAKYLARKETMEQLKGQRVKEVESCKERTIWAREEWRRAAGRAKRSGLWSD